jgi:hypothetical protein
VLRRISRTATDQTGKENADVPLDTVSHSVYAQRTRRKLWQGCGTNPDLAVKIDMIDESRFSVINKLRVINRRLVYPAYRLIRHNLMKQKHLALSGVDGQNSASTTQGGCSLAMLAR